jgi:tellurite resistance protein
MHRLPQIPANVFAIPFGLAGLCEVWRVAVPALGVPQAVPDAFFIVTAVVWLIVVACYAAQGPRRPVTDAHDAVLGAYLPVWTFPPLVLAAALAPSAFAAARVLVIVFFVLMLVFGAAIMGEWITSDIDIDRSHPVYFLPVVAGPLVGADALAAVRLHALAEATFGIGVISWLVMGSLMWNRLFFRPRLPPALIPTMAIEFAPPVVAGVAYFALDGGRIDLIARVLAGYAVFMALVQLRLIPLYARLKFSPGFWAFTFSYASGAQAAMLWLSRTRPPGATGYEIAVLTLITVLIVAIAARTLVAIRRGQYFAPR